MSGTDEVISFEAAIVAISTLGEAKDFVAALLTPAEIDVFSHRWAAFQLSLAGATQREIRDALGVSIATASRSARVVRERGSVVSQIVKQAKERNAS